MTLGEKIRNARIEARLSQKDIADEIGCSQTIISSYEHGIKNPSFNQIEKLAALFKKYKVKVKFL